MSRPIIVLYNNPADGIANALRGRPGVTCLHLDEISTHWKLEDNLPPTVVEYPAALYDCFSGAYVINRIFDFNHSEAGPRLHAAGLHGLWGYVALSPLLQQAAVLAHENGARGVSRSMLPLNAQWFSLGSVCTDITFPAFEFGFGKVDPDLSRLHDAMQKSVWSYFAWKTESNLDDEERDWHRFYVDRPSGTPVVCIYHRDSFELMFPKGPAKVDTALYAKAAAGARQVFASEMGELLFYERDDAPPMFCAFSPYMANATRNPAFGDALASAGGV